MAATPNGNGSPNGGGNGDVLTKLLNTVEQGFAATEKRFDEIDKRFDEVDKRFDLVDLRFAAVDAEFASVRSEIKGVEDRLTQRMNDRFDNLNREFGNQFCDLDARVTKFEQAPKS